MCEDRFPNIFLDSDIWVLILKSTKNFATCKNLWELLCAQYFGKSGLQIACLNLVLEFKSVIKKKMMTDMLHCIDMYFIPNFPKLIFSMLLILFPDAVVKKNIAATLRA